MWFVILLLISNAYAVGCLDNTAEKNHYLLLKSEIDKKISDLGLDKQMADQYMKSISNDPIGIELSQSKNCLGLTNDDISKLDENASKMIPYIPPKTDDPNTALAYSTMEIIIASVAVGVFVILGSEYLHNRTIRNNGKASIEDELIQIKDILRDKVKWEDRDVKFEYAPYSLSTAAFDSVVSSGTLLHFSTELQKSILNTYFQIKNHNKLLQTLDDITIKAEMEEVKPETEVVMFRHQGLLTTNEKLIETYLSETLRFLKS